jgi:hypothetical protein
MQEPVHCTTLGRSVTMNGRAWDRTLSCLLLPASRDPSLRPMATSVAPHPSAGSWPFKSSPLITDGTHAGLSQGQQVWPAAHNMKRNRPTVAARTADAFPYHPCWPPPHVILLFSATAMSFQPAKNLIFLHGGFGCIIIHLYRWALKLWNHRFFFKAMIFAW